MTPKSLSRCILLIYFYTCLNSMLAFSFRHYTVKTNVVNRNALGQTRHDASDNSMDKDAYRIGLGYDIHRLVGTGKGGKPFKLGGVLVDDSKIFVVGHSDGDTLLHALADALLGATGCGDIGDYFSELDSINKDMDSRIILESAIKEASLRGYRPTNIDINIILERVRLGRRLKDAIKKALYDMLGSDVMINVKAKTNEGLDAIGRGEAVSCQVIAHLKRI
ncbi:putative 2-C-methyl-D-erythritol 24-cyclodiphosphate synthase [Babesia bovis T2Bo]|nr:putative 2-C-methyl-D-erythritol 24-cyclodiphosphate synthase [Babesia bovis T2Bo]EDO05878.2 putative 2-C-methyl-D-erythritol 24-cyclodiphosphate synthase [Babesia bovis T2Bo]